uniref:Uncharacterized protein n=1 Tax=Meloidogyne enterolobii TaxID=390850 RepID=A0A6V7V168_MELEN|nr:unnamed protein product [Meloidogyne enterolobii]
MRKLKRVGQMRCLMKRRRKIINLKYKRIARILTALEDFCV